MSNKNIGYALLGVGGIVLVWAMFIFDTSVAVDAYTRVNNLGLLNDQRNYSLIGGAIAVIGVFLIFKGDNDKSQINNSSPTTVNPTSLNFSGFTGDKSLDNDAYKIYLSKKYTIEKNDALGKIIVKDKLFGSIEEALRYADECEKPIVKNTVKHNVQPEIVDAICPNCEAPVNMNDAECWRCLASFSVQSSWQPIKK